MLTINKLRSDSAIDYAAEELKKYLRMMMPECGDIKIFYNPEATDGFRLGLLEDFGLPFEGEDATLDDVVHIETDTQGGILAGSNPRSVLYAVYRMLRENGCRWLYPGIDGDYVPTKDIEPVSYHKLADLRTRGICDEGHPSQEMMLDCIEYYAKLEINFISLEFFLPYGYYNCYYNHIRNEKHRRPEPVSDQQVLQWRRQCEVEVNRRGMMLTSIGHGWTCHALGFPPEHRKYDISEFSEEQRSFVAMVNGKREFYGGMPVLSQVCLSNPRVRTLMAEDVVTFAKNHENIDILAFGFGDSPNAYCECEECRKLTPSEWAFMIINEMDEKLTVAGLNTKVSYGMYLDNMYAPEKVKLNNHKRLVMNYCPITRDYTSSVTKDTPVQEAPRYQLNKNKFPTTEEAYACLKQWQKIYFGDICCFEYHFWRSQYLDPGQQALSRRLYEDVRSMRDMGISGLVEDASQRSGFPNGFMTCLYAETMVNRDCDFEALREDYFKHVYGTRWDKVLKILERISQIFDIPYMQDIYQVNIAYKQPGPTSGKELGHLPKFQRVHDLAAELRYHYERKAKELTRVQTVSWNILWRYSEFMDYYADVMIARCQGHIFESRELAAKFKEEFGKYELEIERYYDHALAMEVIAESIHCQTKLDLPVE